MGYALFAQRKQVLDAELMCSQLQQTQRSNEQFALATEQSGLKQQLSSLAAGQAAQLAEFYGQLSTVTDSTQRNQINDKIKQKEAEFKNETDDINRKCYEVSIREQAIEMEVKRLDTVVTTLRDQLEAVQQAEGQGIQNATPKFGGIS